MNSTIKCVILDDEILALSYLKLLCEQIENVEVVKVFNNPNVFVDEIENLDCNLCILDIEMPGLSGIQVAEKIAGSKKIIFTTAYKNYAAEAFDLNVVDYVRKPIKKERLQQAFDKFREISSKKFSEKKEFIELNTSFGKTKILTNKIAYITTSEIDSRDKEVVLIDKSTIILKNLSLKSLLEILPSKNFVQINKKEIISTDIIQILSTSEIITTLSDKGNQLKLHLGESYRNSVIDLLA